MKLAFILAATDYGPMILPRMDYGPGWLGVGGQLLETGTFDPQETELCCVLVQVRRKCHGDGVVALDCGANIGTHTMAMAKVMRGWGEVTAFEAQERLFYALAGNIALNNLPNAAARHLVVSDNYLGEMMPEPNYSEPGSFGSVEAGHQQEFMGQEIARRRFVPSITIDALAVERLDFIKLDIEGMEMKALVGADTMIARYHPIMLIERIKSDEKALTAWLTERNYKFYPVHLSLLAVHRDDPSRENILMKGDE